MTKLNTDDLLNLMESRREICNIMGNISHDYSVKQEATVYNKYFSRRENTYAWASTTGLL